MMITGAKARNRGSGDPGYPGNPAITGAKVLVTAPTGDQKNYPHPQPGRSWFGPTPNRGAVRFPLRPTGAQCVWSPPPPGSKAPAPHEGRCGSMWAQGPKRHICLRPGVSGVSQTFETRCNGRRQAFSTRRLRLVGRTLQVCPLILCSRQESNSCTCAPDRTCAIDLYSRYAGSRCRWRMRGDFSL